MMPPTTGTHVGMTGTSQGATTGQLHFFGQELMTLNRMAYNKGESLHFHHGDCVGADCECHEVATSIVTPQPIYTHVHPPDKDVKRAFCKGDFMYSPKPYLVRNRDIVDAIKILFVVPRRNVEELRSGTWATYRYAKAMGRHIVMVER